MRITLLGLLLIGCGGGDGGGTEFEGIWRVDTWTDNNMGCAAEGPSVAAGREAFLYTKNEAFPGTSFVNVKGCDDIVTCKELANDKSTIHIGSFGFEEGSDATGWTTHFAFAFASSQGKCEGGVTDTKLTISATTFRIEGRHIEAVPFPATSDPDDECPDASIEQAAAGQPCAGLEVVTATFMQDY
jgi:hypothetical protein